MEKLARLNIQHPSFSPAVISFSTTSRLLEVLKLIEGEVEGVASLVGTLELREDDGRLLFDGTVKSVVPHSQLLAMMDERLQDLVIMRLEVA